MQSHLAKIVLWPRRVECARREINFVNGKVNVVTGWSKTGKSALIPIIDYCLGSETCAIPVGIIRDATEWFGVVLGVGERSFLLARREPGQLQASGEMMMFEGKGEMDIPERPRYNANVDAVKDALNSAFGIPRLDFNTNDGDRRPFQDRASIRDMMAFVFQPQHLIANPFTLYFKADTREHREKLRTVFPLALGIVDGEYLSLRKQLNDIEAQLDVEKRRLGAVEAAAGAWLADLRSDYLQAREFGLLAASEMNDEGWTVSRHIGVLEDVVMRGTKVDAVAELSGENTEKSLVELDKLMAREGEIAEHLEQARTRASIYRQLRNAQRDYEGAVAVHRNYLSLVEWFEGRFTSQQGWICPVCGSSTMSAHDEITALVAPLKGVRQAEVDRAASQGVLERETYEVLREIRTLEKEITAVRRQRTTLEDRSDGSRTQTYQNLLLFLGNLQQSLHNYKLGHSDGDLSDKVATLDRERELLEDRLSRWNAKAKEKQALRKVGAFAEEYLPWIGVERPNDAIEIDNSNLTVKIRGAARSDYLWELGSGSNWLGYHIAALLGLHRMFLEVKGSPVPSILVLDQPSQVYFPDIWPSDLEEESKSPSRDALGRGDDVEGVRRIFRTLARAVEETNGGLQIIVLDHAASPSWQGVARIHVAETWRDGLKKLIPAEWL